MDIDKFICDNCNHDFNDVYDKHISLKLSRPSCMNKVNCTEKIRSVFMNQWIKCLDRMPEDGQSVLVFGIEGDDYTAPDFDLNAFKMVVATYRIIKAGGIFEFDDHCCDRNMYYVSSWMPLPSKPTE